MDYEVGPWTRAFLYIWSQFMVQLPWSDFLKKLVLKALGLSLRVNQMWTRKNDHAPKSDCVVVFFKYMSKMGSFEKHSSLTILLSPLGLHLPSLLVKNVSKMWLANLQDHNNFYTKMNYLICTNSM